MPLIHSKSLSLLLFLILYTLADDSTPPGPTFQDPSSSAISFPHDVDDSNGLKLSGWTTAVDLGNTGDDHDDLIDQQDVFLPAAVDQTMVACAGPATSQDGSPPTPGKRRSRLLRKRKLPESCVAPGYLNDVTSPPSSSGGTSTTTNRRPGRPPGKTVPKAKPIQTLKPLPLLGDPDSPLCNQYFPGVGSNYAVCYYPFFKTIPRSPLVHVLSPCRAYSFGDPCTSSEEIWCCGTTWPRPPDTFQQLNPQLGIRYSISGYACLYVDLIQLDNVPV